MEVSSKLDDVRCYPIYRRSLGLVDISDDHWFAGFDPLYAFGKTDEKGIYYFPGHQAVDEGYLESRDIDIAWKRQKIDLFSFMCKARCV